ncbi:MAG: hypothetical protein L6Q66_07360 [Bacteroidia bacterium]|nr:hypothetical protein [Bacteroidia bacterium]
MAKQEIKLGYTFEYFIPGVLSIILGAVFFFWNIVLGAMVLCFGIALILLQTGIEIDRSKNKLRKFYQLFPIKFGQWLNMGDFSAVELRRTNESQTMQHRAGQTTVETKTFDIILLEKSGRIIELNDFKSYSIAAKTLILISETFLLQSRNEVEEIRKAAMQRRKERNFR